MAKFSWEVAAILPVIFCLILSGAISDTLVTDLIVYKTCITTMLLPETTCAILHNNSSSEEAKNLSAEVQQNIAPVIISNNVMKALIPMVLSLFLGPWSDKFGRKVLLLISLTGYVVNYLSLSIMSSWDLSPYWILLASFSESLLGGRPTIFLTFLCYISDLSRLEDKAWNLALMDTAIYLSLPVGFFIGPYIFKHYGYPVVFGISAGGCLFAVLYLLIVMRETVEYTGHENRWKNLFDMSLIKDLIQALTKKREKFNRTIVWFCLISLLLDNATLEGAGAVTFLFTSARLGWGITEFSTFSAANFLIGSFGSLTAVKFGSGVFKIQDTTIVLLGILSGFTSCIIKAFTLVPWQFYVSSVAGIFNYAMRPIFRSIVAKNMPEKDLSKAFSLMPTIEMLVPFATNPLYILTYTSFMPPSVYPSPVWFLSCAFLVLVLILTLQMERLLRSVKNSV